MSPNCVPASPVDINLEHTKQEEEKVLDSLFFFFPGESLGRDGDRNGRRPKTKYVTIGVALMTDAS